MKIRSGIATFAATCALLVAACADDATTPSGTGDTGGADATADATDTGSGDDATADAAADSTVGPDATPDVTADATPDAEDAANDTTDTADTAEDTADVTPPEDVTGDADVTVDTVLPPGEDQAFRVSTLALLTPEMCYDLNGDGECDAVNVFVNAIIEGELTDGVEPLDVMGVISPFDVPTDEAVLSLGAAACERPDGGGPTDVTSCSLVDDPEAPPAVFEQVLTKDDGGCSANPLILAPCFTTSNQQSLSLTLLDIPFTFLQAKVAGKFDAVSFDGITDGYIRGFMPVTTAAGVMVDIPGKGFVKLSELLAEAPKTTVDDKNGWVFEFAFSADRVELGGE